MRTVSVPRARVLRLLAALAAAPVPAPVRRTSWRNPGWDLDPPGPISMSRALPPYYGPRSNLS